MAIRAVHSYMEIFKFLLSSAYKVRIEEFKVYQTKFFLKNTFLGLQIGFSLPLHYFHIGGPDLDENSVVRFRL